MSETQWDSEQLASLYANVYARRLECPTCGGALDFIASREPATAGTAACGPCGARHVVSLANDPLRDSFRDYTDAEKRQLFSADRARKSPTCPVDATLMDVHLQRSLGRTSNVVITCRRCTHKAEYVRTCG